MAPILRLIDEDAPTISLTGAGNIFHGTPVVADFGREHLELTGIQEENR